MTDNAVKMPSGFCPHCENKIDAATSITSKKKVHPKPGDITICLYCAVILKFGEGNTTTVYPLDELRQLAQNAPELMVQLGNVWFAAKQRLSTRPPTVQ